MPKKTNKTTAAAIEPTQPQPKQPHQFLHDERNANQKLHLLYMKWAIKHLMALDCIQKEIGEFANGNLLGVQVALERERRTLIQTNAAYFDAQEVLHSIVPYMERMFGEQNDPPPDVAELMADWLKPMDSDGVIDE
jgi:hypothetical protein